MSGKKAVKARKERLSASLEDYIEVIFNLADRDNGVRATDIANRLGVSKASVTGALKVLKKKGLANYQPYDSVTLTEAGRIAAAEVVRKHNILKSFFTNILGVESPAAHRAACKAEHTLGPEIIGRLLSFTEFVTHENEHGNDLLGRFDRFSRRQNPRTAPVEQE